MHVTDVTVAAVKPLFIFGGIEFASAKLTRGKASLLEWHCVAAIGLTGVRSSFFFFLFLALIFRVKGIACDEMRQKYFIARVHEVSILLAR